ncbi:coiled-coil domain-containing protein 24 isoform X1 [Chelonia mydas]|uniref:coiled-coil domain-containing protein 24 isoform X1 n=1 Tax=Chelonia mydas TaxID=8469 RepID=UPI001CAA2805|nr:coiled-coil domain-containing protein 24 isoform X1 [Chelonia mydas]
METGSLSCGRCPHVPCPLAAAALALEAGGGAGGAQREARGEEHPGGGRGGAQLGAARGGGDPGGAVAGGALGLRRAGSVPPAGGWGLGSPDSPHPPQGAGETGAPDAAAQSPAEGVPGGDAAGAIAKYSPHVVSFALGPHAGGECAAQDRSLSGGTSTSPDPDLVHHLEPLKDKLSVSRIHEAQTHLRALLEEECRALERHICQLRRCLEQEHRAAAGPAQEPTMAELQEQRRAMERDLQLGQLDPRPGFSQEVQCPEPVAPRQPRCPVGLESPAPASVSTRLAPAAPSPSGRQEPAPPAPSAVLGRVPLDGCSCNLGSLAGGLHGGAATPGWASGHQDLAAPSPPGAGVPPASPACSRLAPLPAGPSLAFLPSPPAEQRPPLRPLSGRHLRLLGCQGPS